MYYIEKLKKEGLLIKLLCNRTLDMLYGEQ